MKFKHLFRFGCLIALVFFQQSKLYSQISPSETADFKKVVSDIFAQVKKTTYVNGQPQVSTGIRLEEICRIETDKTHERIFQEYGAIFISEGTVLPSMCIYTGQRGATGETDVDFFQRASNRQTENIGGVMITLQSPAMRALQAARAEAAKQGLKITPRGGSLAGGRSFEDTEKLWQSRFQPALTYYVGRRKISRQEADRATAMSIPQQVAQVLEWEDTRRLFFSKDLSKSILFSVAAPGASQHNFLLALDVEQFANPKTRLILAKHGWFQTVKSDFPHFTYLGKAKEDLPRFGLRMEKSGGHEFWIPNIVESPAE